MSLEKSITLSLGKIMPGFGIWDLAWNLAIRVKFGTCEQNSDFLGPKFGTLIANVLCIQETSAALLNCDDKDEGL